MEPNRHKIIAHIVDHVQGTEYDGQVAGYGYDVIEGSLEVALAALRDCEEQASKPPPEGYHRVQTHTNFRLHSWYQPPLTKPRIPLDGPDWDDAWINGPGAPDHKL